MIGQRLGRSVLGIRDFRLLWIGQTVSIAGDMIFPVAVTLAVIDFGGSAGDVGLVLAARWVALVLFVIVGGVWADRLPRKLLMMGADAFRAAAVLAIAGYPGEAPIWALAALVFLVGGGEAFFRPAYGALIPAIVPEERRAAANGLTSVSLRTGAIVGPALGAALVATVGIRAAFLVDAMTFLTVTSIDWLSSMALLPLGLALTGPAADTFGRGAVLGTGLFVVVVTCAALLLVPGMKRFGIRERSETTAPLAVAPASE